MEETGVPGEDHRLTGNFLTSPGRDSNPGSGERQLAVSGGSLDHTVVRAGPSHKCMCVVDPCTMHKYQIFYNIPFNDSLV